MATGLIIPSIAVIVVIVEPETAFISVLLKTNTKTDVIVISADVNEQTFSGH